MVNLREIEEKWQAVWEERKVFEANCDRSKPKFLVTFPYPYVNGLLHLGHALTSARAEFIARYKRLRGYNVLWAQGWHLTGSPIVAAVYRLKLGDEKIKRDLIEMHVPEEEIDKFRDPVYWARYFVPKAKEAFKKLGYSMDWRREFFTTYLNPHYSKFIEWQYLKLLKRMYIEKGKHPVIYDAVVGKVIGDHDRPDEYVGISYVEGVIIKFRGEYEGREVVLPCYTLRPETIYGVTNVWINPRHKYVLARVNGELWILPNSIVIEDLKHQERRVEVLEEVEPARLILSRVTNPVTGERIPILPAEFVNVEVGTGVVMSVPAHAPYDYIALVDLTKDARFKQVAEACLNNMRPLFYVEGHSEFPAKDLCEKLKVSSQRDVDRLDKATQELYSKEFYMGVTREIFGKYAGKRICEIKDEFEGELLKSIAEKFYTIPVRFQSRYGNKVVVKVISDQWFLRYSDREWKDLSLSCLAEMNIIPDYVRKDFQQSILNMREWAFTHKEELGTHLPWDKEWVIESLSDSTIYMAYYTIAHLVTKIEPEKLTEEVFDYVFLGVGDADAISAKYGINEDLLKKMREEFDYWYPMDLRVSGKDLIPNHLTFMIFQHTAVFPRDKWPRGVAINGFLLINGEKMSKSKGNIIPILDAVERYSVDALRLSIAYAGNSGSEDLNLELESIKLFEEELKAWYEFCLENYGKGREGRGLVDTWFENVLYKAIKDAEVEYERLNYKTIVSALWFDLKNKLKWYLRRCKNNPNREVLEKYIVYRTIALYPIVPHIASEILEKLGLDPLNISWPKIEEVNEDVVKQEDYVESLLNDIRSIVRVVGRRGAKVSKAKVIVAREEKYGLVREVGELAKATELDKAIRDVKARHKDFADLLDRVRKSPDILNYRFDRSYEVKILKDAQEFLESELNVELVIELEEESSEPKAALALPYKPAIVLL